MAYGAHLSGGDYRLIVDGRVRGYGVAGADGSGL